MPRCPRCRQHDATTELVTLVDAGDGRGATFRCRECKNTFRAKGPHARRAAAATPPIAQVKPSTPPPATSRTGQAPARPQPRDE